MFILNPCALYTFPFPISFHRSALCILLLFDFILLLLLRLMTLFFRNGHKQRVDDILQMKTPQARDTIKVEELQEQTEIKMKEDRPKKIRESQDELVRKQTTSSASSQSQEGDNKDEEEEVKQKYWIELGKYKVKQEELLDMICIMIGHKCISIGLVLLYYPFAMATIIAFLQSLAHLLSTFLNICVPSPRLQSFLHGSIYLGNLLLLILTSYGISTRTIQAEGKYCFDL